MVSGIHRKAQGKTNKVYKEHKREPKVYDVFLSLKRRGEFNVFYMMPQYLCSRHLHGSGYIFVFLMGFPGNFLEFPKNYFAAKYI